GRRRVEGDGARVDRVDAHLVWRQGYAWRGVRKALGMGFVGCVERGLSDGADLIDAAEEDVGGSEEGEAGVVVLVVVPAEEGSQPASRVHLAQEAPRIVGLVLEGLEL